MNALTAITRPGRDAPPTDTVSGKIRRTELRARLRAES